MICFIVTSVIYFAENPLSYSDMRSIFSPEERARQTLKTIESIRGKSPGARIVLVEMGLKRELPLGVAEACDEYLYIGGSPFVRWACDGRLKGVGEVVGLLAAAEKVRGMGDYFIKISGRYFLTDRFDLGKWDQERIVLHKLTHKDVSTRLYGFPKRYFATWKAALWKSIPLLWLQERSLERIFPKFLPKNRICYLDSLGVAGVLAPHGSTVDE